MYEWRCTKLRPLDMDIFKLDAKEQVRGQLANVVQYARELLSISTHQCRCVKTGADGGGVYMVENARRDFDVGQADRTQIGRNQLSLSTFAKLAQIYMSMVQHKGWPDVDSTIKKSGIGQCLTGARGDQPQHTFLLDPITEPSASS